MPRPLHGHLVLAAVLVAGCATYTPQPVDLAEHARVFAARLPDLEAVRAFALALDDKASVPADAVDLATGKRVALWFHPELRQLRAEAGVARATADHAGLLPDPYLQGSVAKKLGNTNPWLVTSAFGLTLPLSGQLGRAKDLAEAQHDRALLHVLVRETEVQDELELTWVRWSTHARAVELLERLLSDLDALCALADRLREADELTIAEARAFRLERVERRSELLAATAVRDATRADLDACLGLPPANGLPLQPHFAVAARRPVEGSDQDEMLAGPRLALLHRDHAVRERDLELQVSKQWPMVVLGPGTEEEDATNRPVINFLLPLPLWNRNRQAIAQAEAARELAATALRTGLERTLQDLHRATANAEAARARAHLVDEELVPLCAAQLDDVKRAADLGHLDPLLILDAVTRVHEAQYALLQARLDEAAAVRAANACFWPEPPTAAETAPPVAPESPAEGVPR